MSDPPAIVQQLNLMLTAYGYDLYKSENRARADDLLVRQQASAALGEATAHLTQLAAEYTRRFIPPSSREQPFPPADRMAQLRELNAVSDEVSLLASRIRGMSVPTQDRVWAKFRGENETLHRLLSFDYQLITQAKAIGDQVAGLTADEWSSAAAAEVRSLLHALQESARAREAFLTTPF